MCAPPTEPSEGILCAGGPAPGPQVNKHINNHNMTMFIESRQNNRDQSMSSYT